MANEINYGVQIEPQFGYEFKEIYDIVQSAENNQFSHAWFSDHFMMTKNSTDLTSYECFTAMMAAASQTKKLRIGALVFCNSYRHPAVLAKQISSLDHFSNGRVEFGYGSGWKEIEYNAYGIEFPSAGIRIKQLSEGIEVIKSLWREEYANFSGEYYNLKDAVSYPKPYQKPYPPIWVGTMEAKPKMLKLAAKQADGLNIAWSFAPDVYQDKLQRIAEYCDKYDRDPSTLMMSYGVWTRIYESEEEKHEVMKDIADRRGFKVEEVEKRYEGSLHGTLKEIKDKLNRYKKLGITHFVFMFPQNQEIKSMETFSKEIIGQIS